MKRAFYPAVAASVLALSGCVPSAEAPASNECPSWNDNVPPQSAPEDQNNTPPTRTVDVAACSAGLSQADFDANLKLAKTVETDFGEQRACGLLLRNYAFSLSHWFAAAACGQASYPSGFAYNGSGYYLVGGIMGVQAKLAKDTSYGKKGDDVPFDLFDQLTYGDGPLIINATISAETTWSTDNPDDLSVRLKGTLNITVEKPKPEGLELWGLAADGKAVDKQQEELAKAIGESVVFAADANVSSLQSGGGVTYRFQSSETTVDATYNSKPLGLQLVDIVATDKELNQSTSLVHYGVSFIPYPHGPLSGSFIIKIEGGKFPYYVRYSYPDRVQPDVLISCTQPAP
jgi:hypothetical protein